MKKQGILFFKDLDLNQFEYPVVIVCDGDLFSDSVTGPFENAQELEQYIKKENLHDSRNYYTISTIKKP